MPALWAKPRIRDIIIGHSLFMEKRSVSRLKPDLGPEGANARSEAKGVWESDSGFFFCAVCARKKLTRAKEYNSPDYVAWLIRDLRRVGILGKED